MGSPSAILAVDNLRSKRPLVQSDLSLLMGIASVIGISIRNADLMEARQRQFDSILQVLAASIDARDPLTAGHSEKVTEYALGICGQLNLSSNYREMIRVASLLHDYGKIGVPDSILKKTGETDKGRVRNGKDARPENAEHFRADQLRRNIQSSSGNCRFPS